MVYKVNAFPTPTPSPPTCKTNQLFHFTSNDGKLRVTNPNQDEQSYHSLDSTNFSLHHSVALGNTKRVTAALQKSKRPEDKIRLLCVLDPEGKTALHWAASGGE